MVGLRRRLVGRNSVEKSKSHYKLRIVRAWASELGCAPEAIPGLVHFPKNCVYKIDRNSVDYVAQFQKVFKRLSYFAKADTKHYDDGSNWFGCSRG